MGKVADAGTKQVIALADTGMDGVELTVAELQEAVKATVNAPVEVVDATANAAREQLAKLRKEYMDVAKAAVQSLSDLSPV